MFILTRFYVNHCSNSFIFHIFVFNNFDLQVLNEIKLVSFELNPFNVTAEGHFEFQISSVISLFGSHIQLDGSYNGGDKTFSFSASTRNDTKPILLSNLVPAFASIPVRIYDFIFSFFYFLVYHDTAQKFFV